MDGRSSNRAQRRFWRRALFTLAALLVLHIGTLVLALAPPGGEPSVDPRAVQAIFSLKVVLLVMVALFVIRPAMHEVAREAERLAEANRGLIDSLAARTATAEASAGQLARSNADLERFAHVASHDLQEPLRMVASYIQLLRRRLGDHLDNESREFMGYAIEGSLRMQLLVTDLRTYASLSSPQPPPTPTDLDGVAASALTDLKVAIEEAGATVWLDPLPRVLGIAVQLRQVFQNLVANAIKFRSETPPVVNVSSRLSGAEWVISVRDNGIGIDPQYQPKLFQIFSRLHGRGKYPGTGLGLALCKRIVEGHGGRIWVESRPGSGSTFVFTLPVYVEPSSPRAAPTWAPLETVEQRSRQLV